MPKLDWVDTIFILGYAGGAFVSMAYNSYTGVFIGALGMVVVLLNAEEKQRRGETK